jgi:hypothetical protein
MDVARSGELLQRRQRRMRVVEVHVRRKGRVDGRPPSELQNLPMYQMR